MGCLPRQREPFFEHVGILGLGSMGIIEMDRGWDDRGKTLWQDTPKKEMLRFSRFQQKLFMVPTLKTETENFHGKSHPEVIKVHRGHQSPPLRENWWQQIW